MNAIYMDLSGIQRDTTMIYLLLCHHHLFLYCHHDVDSSVKGCVFNQNNSS